MTRSPSFGLFLATAAALLLSPDTLMMRLSGLDGFAMMAWRGGLSAPVLLSVWFITSGHRRRDLGFLFSGAGLAVAACQFVNAAVFSLSISVAPVSVVLFGVATVPVCAAVFARILLGETAGAATWITIAAVLSGIAIAVFGDGGGAVGFDVATFLGALGGLVVAGALALTFVLLRAHGHLPILLTLGTGAALSGASGLILAGANGVTDGNLIPIAIAGLGILPASFFMLSLASRFTDAANVSLLLLLETALGPLLVWAGTGEAVGGPAFLGGSVVIASLAIYLMHARRVTRRG
ncbi:DMT family transporter [Oceaniglobus indicus]|uniref:DMT family transporter n=1 Tax=Oceaniglobus indicus TaxID=2047749 RepID=UPI000C17AB25|nr:DMT family transporter [Oceaniglobus indicus]